MKKTFKIIFIFLLPILVFILNACSQKTSEIYEINLAVDQGIITQSDLENIHLLVQNNKECEISDDQAYAIAEKFFESRPGSYDQILERNPILSKNTIIREYIEIVSAYEYQNFYIVKINERLFDGPPMVTDGGDLYIYKY